MILNQALEKLDCYDRINEWISEGAEDVVFDAASFLRFSSLDWVFIDPNGDSEFQYTSGGPLLRIFISQDINVLDTFFDGLM